MSFYSGLSNLTAAAGSKSLSASLRTNNTLLNISEASWIQLNASLPSLQPTGFALPPFNSFQIYLLYENAHGEITWILGSFEYSAYYPYRSLRWQDLTDLLQNVALQYNISLSTVASPLSSTRAPPIGFERALSIELTILIPLGDGWFQLFLPWFNDSSAHPIITYHYLPADIDATMGYITSGGAYDADYGFFVNGSSLVGYGFLNPLESPISPFPFVRLASSTPTNSSVFFLYHQMNEAVLAEDMYDTSIGHWISTNVTVSIA